MPINTPDKNKDKRHRTVVDDLGVKPKEAIEILASSIKKISEAFQEILIQGELTEECLVVLLHRKTAVSMGDITRVLRALPRLKAWYLK